MEEITEQKSKKVLKKSIYTTIIIFLYYIFDTREVERFVLTSVLLYFSTHDFFVLS